MQHDLFTTKENIPLENLLPRDVTKKEIINWANQKNVNRHYIEVHVPDKEFDHAMQLMKDSTITHDKVSKEPELDVRIEKNTEYSVVLRVLF